MAIYDYECPQCGWTGELFAKISECDEQRCPKVHLVRSFHFFGAPPGTPTTYVCNALLKRSEEIPLSNIDPAGSFQTGAITSKGQLIPGRFGASSGKIKKGFNKACEIRKRP